MNRATAFTALVGSHNYNISTPKSDRDYKIFMIPNFNDLYEGKMFSKATTSKNYDYEYHDIRKLGNLLWKSNLNFLEVLYSKDKIIMNRHVKKLFKMRDEIAKMNLPYLYKACKGMYFEKMKRFDKEPEVYGYNPKEATGAYRILDFICRFAQTRFNDFEYAFSYTGRERDVMLDMRRGSYDKESMEAMIKLKFSLFEELENKYLNEVPNKKLKDDVDNIIFTMVERSVLKRWF